MISGPCYKREIATVTKRKETERLHEDTEEEKVTTSDILMSIGVYIAMPLMAIGSIALAIHV